MPQQNLSGKLGKSSSPIVNRVLKYSENNQQVENPATVTKSGQYNKHTVSPDPGK